MPAEKTRPRAIPDLAAWKQDGRKLAMLTCYDALFARLLEASGVDLLLVGDSLHQVLGGHETTLGATLDAMIYHAAAVRRGARETLVFIDLPFLTYQVSVAEAVRNAGRAMQEANVHGVKLEGGRHMAPTIHALTDVGIPVMAHLGLTPQSVHQLGGYRVQGRDQEGAERLLADARAVEEAGACAVVLELVPSKVAKKVTAAVGIPTIGIGAGPHCDGQVLVLHDMLGLNEGFDPKFLKKYGALAGATKDAVRQYVAEVRAGKFPDAGHSFE
ncbi:MAG TPA: 3-methyl-2-oxobutanoate hydroxymethyltransferase [Gemmatimonadales bacterium]|nr:3-methyl-2-oxobutanoate hydroxymethyltransferase [Gemmatimonadales bacterium]